MGSGNYLVDMMDAEEDRSRVFLKQYRENEALYDSEDEDWD